MNVIKSAVVGMLLVFGFALASPLLAMAIAMLLPSPKGGGSWGWDPVSFVRSPLAWAILAAIFAAGFVWEYRRLAH